MTTPPFGGYADRYQPQIDFGWFARAWELLRARFGLWLGATLLCGVIAALIDLPVAVVSGYAGYVAGLFRPFVHPGMMPMYPRPMLAYYGSGLVFGLVANVIAYLLLGGCYSLALRQIRREPLSIANLFDGFRRLPSLLVASIVVQVCVILGSYLCLIPGLVAQGLFMFVPALIVDRNLGPAQALSESVNLLKRQWIMAAAFYFVASLLLGLGAAVLGIGILVTFPLFVLTIAVGYSAFTQPAPQAAPIYADSGPGTWPPPPSADGR